MAQYTGNKGKCLINAVTYNVTDWSLDDSIQPIDITAQNTTAATSRSYISDGLIDTDSSITFDVSDTIAAPVPTVGAVVAFELQDENYKYTGNCLIVTSSTPRAVGEKVVCAFAIKVSGGVTRAASDI